MKLDLDFRLLDISLEVYALENHLQLIKTQILHLRTIENKALEEYIKKEKLELDIPEQNILRQECEYKIEVLIPRFFWGAFLVALYAVYETAITEIAKLIQTSQKQEVSMNDLKGGLLKRAKKYYKNILTFNLCDCTKTWQRIEMLAELRNAIAHVNGRIDMLKPGSQRKIKAWEQQNIGISSDSNFLLVDEIFSEETFSTIRLSIEDLVKRYKEWDTNIKK